jgi:hypothetical protein
MAHRGGFTLFGLGEYSHGVTEKKGTHKTQMSPESKSFFFNCFGAFP